MALSLEGQGDQGNEYLNRSYQGSIYKAKFCK